MANLLFQFVMNGVNNTRSMFNAIGRDFDAIQKKLNQKPSTDPIAEALDQVKALQQGMEGAVTSGMIKANLAIGAVERTFSWLKGKVMEGSNIELENLSTASGIANLMGGNFDKAAQFVDNLNSKLAAAAATLPGATSDYSALARTITDDVANAFKDANGQISDMDGFSKTLESISTSYAAMGATSGVAIGNTQLFLMKALGGTASMAELTQIDALQKNTQLRNALEAKLNGRSLKDLGAEERIKLLDEVGKSVITPEFLARSTKTLDGMMQGFISALFDPMGGLFGILRDLSPDEGQQTVYNAAKDVISTLIGPDGIFYSLQRIFNNSGLADPMVVLRTILINIAAGMKHIANIAQDMADLVVAGGGLMAPFLMLKTYIEEEFGINFDSSIGNIGTWLTTSLNDMLRRLQAFFESINIDFYALGAQVADVLDLIVGNVINFFMGLDYGAIGQILWMGVKNGFMLIAGFLGNLDISGEAIALGAVLVTVVAPAVIGFVTQAMVWFAGATAGMPVLLAIAAGLAIGLFIKTVIESWDEISHTFQEAMAGIGPTIRSFVTGFLDVLIGGITLDFDRIQKGVSELFTGVQQYIDNLKNTVAYFTGGQTVNAQNQQQIQAQQTQTAAASGYRYVNIKQGGQISQMLANDAQIANYQAQGYQMQNINGQDTLVKPDGSAGGNLPNTALGRLIGSAIGESRAMPAGSQLTMANTSEMILNRQQQAALAGGLGGSGMNLSPVFYITEAGSAQDTAMEVLNVLENLLMQRLNNQLGG